MYAQQYPGYAQQQGQQQAASPNPGRATGGAKGKPKGKSPTSPTKGGPRTGGFAGKR
jgi:hypothetical protein